MELVHVERAKSVNYFDRVNRIYIDSFPDSQIRPNEMLRQMLGTDPNYHLFIARHQDSLVGFSLLYTFSELGVGLLDFMAIDREHRGQNIGSNLFRYTLERCWMLINNCLGVVLEVQRESSLYRDRDNIRRKRIIFYRRLGAKIFDGVHYLLPNLHGGKLEDMYLMMVPRQDLQFVLKEFVFCVIKAVYRTFYDTYETNQMGPVMADLPSKIKLI